MNDILRADPGHGDFTYLRKIAGTYLSAAVNDAVGLSQDLGGVDAGLTPEVWSGEGRVAFGGAVGQWQGRLGDVATRCGLIGSTIRGYCDTVEEVIRPVVFAAAQALLALQQAASGADWVRRSADGAPYYHSATYTAAWITFTGPLTAYPQTAVGSSGSGLVCPVEEETLAVVPWTRFNASGTRPDRSRNKVSDKDAWAAYLTAETAVHAERIEDQYWERRAADEKLGVDLAGITPEWAEQRALYEYAGITNPANMSPTRLAAQMAAILDGVYPGGPLTPEVEARLSEFYATFGSDAATMSAFYTAMGADNTFRLTAAVGWSDYTLACTIRDTLALGTMTWTPQQADTYLASARTVTDAEIDGLTSAVAFLFNGPNAGGPILGAAVCAAGATWAEEWEARRQHAWVVNHAEVTQTTRPVNGHLRPVWANQPGEGWVYVMDNWIVNATGVTYAHADVSGNILRSLGTYPVETTAWLTDADGRPNEARITTWYTDRDWTVAGDGFRAPMALWAATQDASLRPAPPEDVAPADDPAWKSAAALFSSLATSLMSNEAFTVADASNNDVRVDLAALHDDATLTLAAIMATALPQIQTLWITENIDAPLAPQDGYFEANLPYGTAQMPIPVVNHADLADLLGAAGSSEGGRARLMAGFEAYRQFLVAGASASGEPTSTQIETVTRHLTELAGIIGTNADIALLDHGFAQDRAADQAFLDDRSSYVTAGGIILSLPLEFAGAWGLPLGIGAGLTEGYVGSLPFDPHTDGINAAHGQVTMVIDNLYHSHREAVIATAVQLYGADQLGLSPLPTAADYPRLSDPHQRDELAAARDRWYTAAVEAINARYRQDTGSTQFDIESYVAGLHSDLESQ